MSDKLGLDRRPTKYKEGFEYVNQQGNSCVLIKWADSGFGIYRWKIKLVVIGDFYTEAWTDDRWIDVCLGNAYLDTNTHQIIATNVVYNISTEN